MPPRRFERLTYGLGIRCSILLSYGGLFNFKLLLVPLIAEMAQSCEFSISVLWILQPFMDVWQELTKAVSEEMVRD